MIPQYPDFKPLEIDDRGWISRHLKQIPRKICELTAGNLFIWLDFDRPQITCINKDICVLISPPNEPPYFLEPLGRNQIIETVETCLKHAGRISRASEEFISLLPADSFRLTPLRSQFDYLYLTQDLAQLKGRRFDGKRNHLKRFRRRVPDYAFVPLSPGHKKPALELFEKWFKVREESKYFPKLAHTAQKNAIVSAFDNFDKIKLFGSALLVEKELRGFTLGSFLNPETASVHFLYGDPDWPGISQAILWEACNKTYCNFKYVDLEQDLGIPGLRISKLSYHPIRLEKKFEVKFRAAA